MGNEGQCASKRLAGDQHIIGTDGRADARQHCAQFAGLTVRLAAPRVPAAWQPRILRQDAGLFHIRLDSYAEMETLLRALREENIAIAELSLAETDLEQVFLRIMKNPDSVEAAAVGA